MFDRIVRLRDEAERDVWRAVRTAGAAAAVLTLLAILLSPFPALFISVAFLALVAWFVTLGFLALGTREATAT